MKLATFIAAGLFAWVISYVVYFGFTTNYTTSNFSPASFRKQYTHDVFRYRVLSQYLLLQLDHRLEGVVGDGPAEKRLLMMDESASRRFYLAFYYLNTFFLVLTALLLALLLEKGNLFVLQSGEKLLFLFLAIALMGLTQYVVCPYDISSYFFEVLGIYLYFRLADRRALMLVVLSLVTVVATLNRESSVLMVVFVGMLAVCREGWTVRSVGVAGLLLGMFVVTYFGLRVVINEPDGVISPYHHLFFYNLGHLQNEIGGLFWLLLFYLTMAVAVDYRNRYLICLFHIGCLPYIWTCLNSGILWELRLYMPLFLGGFLLAKMDTTGFGYTPIPLSARMKKILQKGYSPNRENFPI
jgi:hypothetical protein